MARYLAAKKQVRSDAQWQMRFCGVCTEGTTEGHTLKEPDQKRSTEETVKNH